MNTHPRFAQLIRGAVVVGALAASLSASAAFADHSRGHGKDPADETATATATATPAGTASATASPTATATASPTATATATVAPTGTATATVAPTGTAKATAAPTGTPTANVQANQASQDDQDVQDVQDDQDDQDGQGNKHGQSQAAHEDGGHGKSLEHRQAISGWVESFGSDSFVLETRHWGPITIKVVASGEDATEFSVSGHEDTLSYETLTTMASSATSDVHKLRLNVKGDNDGDTFTARRVVVHEDEAEVDAEVEDD
jgi:hypothetical protein